MRKFEFGKRFEYKSSPDRSNFWGHRYEELELERLRGITLVRKKNVEASFLLAANHFPVKVCWCIRKNEGTLIPSLSKNVKTILLLLALCQ